MWCADKCLDFSHELLQLILPFLFLCFDVSLPSAYYRLHVAKANRDSCKYFLSHASHLKLLKEIYLDMHNANGSIPNLLRRLNASINQQAFFFYKDLSHNMLILAQ